MGEKKPSLSPFTVMYGGEDYFLDCDLEKARAWPGRYVVLLDGDSVNAVEIVNVCETRCFDERDRVVIVDNANKVKADKTLKQYIDDKAPSDVSVILVAICRGDSVPEVWGGAAKKGRLVQHKKLKTWENNNEVIKWIPEEAKRLGISLDKGVADMLYKFVGADLHKITNELRKLTILVGKGGKATIDQLKSVAVPVMPADPFQIVEATLRKDEASAMNAISLFYRNTGDEASIIISTSLMRQVEKLAVARQLLDKGTPEDEVASRIEMHAFRFRNFFLPMVKRHSLPSMQRLCKLDADVKGPSRSKRTLVELAVLSIIR
jgi:DNA polymerase-3 subunit delta